ncbi:MAG: hypothetical protein II943_13040 [Victivallales bacterium]|nr:hypothetical protein [Victivallales bacterium]
MSEIVINCLISCIRKFAYKDVASAPRQRADGDLTPDVALPEDGLGEVSCSRLQCARLEVCGQASCTTNAREAGSQWTRGVPDGECLRLGFPGGKLPGARETGDTNN